MVVWYYERLKICRQRRELQLQFLVAVVHRSYMFFHPLRQNHVF